VIDEAEINMAKSSCCINCVFLLMENQNG